MTRLGAVAYTQGSALHFAPGEYRPGTLDGDRLLGHELVHVTQQRAGRVRGIEQSDAAAPVVDEPGLEAEADERAIHASRGEQVPTLGRGEPSRPPSSPPVNAPIQRKPADPKAKPTTATPTSANTLEDTLGAVSSNYAFIVLKQRDGVADIKSAAEKSKEPSSMLLEVLAFAADVALVAASAGVGSAIAQRVEKKLLAALSTAAGAAGGKRVDSALGRAERSINPAKLVADIMKDTAKAQVKQGVEKVKELAKSGSPPLTAYFDGMRDHYTDQSQHLATQFNLVGKQKIRDAAEPQTNATSLLESVQEEYDNAKRLTADETLKGWLSYLPKSRLGVKGVGLAATTMPGSHSDLFTPLREPKVKGLLYLVTDQSPDANIETARLAGADAGLRNPLKGRTLSDLRIPFVMRSPERYELMVDEGGILIGLDLVRSDLSWLGQFSRNKYLGGEHPGRIMAFEGATYLVNKVLDRPLPAVDD